MQLAALTIAAVLIPVVVIVVIVLVVVVVKVAQIVEITWSQHRYTAKAFRYFNIQNR